MKTIDALSLIGILIGLILVILGTIGMIHYMSFEKIVTGDCYDEHNHKINELTCEVVEYPEEYDIMMVIMFSGFFMVFIFIFILNLY